MSKTHLSTGPAERLAAHLAERLSASDVGHVIDVIDRTASEAICEDAKMIDGIRSPVARAALWRCSAVRSADVGLRSLAEPEPAWPDEPVWPRAAVMLAAWNARTEVEAWVRCLVAMLEAFTPATKETP